MKKSNQIVKKLVGIVFFMGLIPLSCGCPETNDYYSMIQEFSVDEQVNFSPMEGNKNLNSMDTLTFLFSVSKSAVTDIWQIGAFDFSNSAFALSQCPEDKLLGWVNKVDSVKIVSNQSFNGIPAGNNIKEKFSGYSRNEYPLNSPMTLSSLSFVIKDFNGEIGSKVFGQYGDYLKLILSEKPEVNTDHKFSFTFYSKGKALNTVESSKINFKP